MSEHLNNVYGLEAPDFDWAEAPIFANWTVELIKRTGEEELATAIINNYYQLKPALEDPERLEPDAAKLLLKIENETDEDRYQEGMGRIGYYHEFETELLQSYSPAEVRKILIDSVKASLMIRRQIAEQYQSHQEVST